MFQSLIGIQGNSKDSFFESSGEFIGFIGSKERFIFLSSHSKPNEQVSKHSAPSMPPIISGTLSRFQLGVWSV